MQSHPINFSELRADLPLDCCAQTHAEETRARAFPLTSSTSPPPCTFQPCRERRGHHTKGEELSDFWNRPPPPASAALGTEALWPSFTVTTLSKSHRGEGERAAHPPRLERTWTCARWIARVGGDWARSLALGAALQRLQGERQRRRWGQVARGGGGLQGGCGVAVGGGRSGLASRETCCQTGPSPPD